MICIKCKREVELIASECPLCGKINSTEILLRKVNIKEPVIKHILRRRRK